MLEKHNHMLVELLTKLHPAGSLARDDLRSLTKASGAPLCPPLPPIQAAASRVLAAATKHQEENI